MNSFVGNDSALKLYNQHDLKLAAPGRNVMDLSCLDWADEVVIQRLVYELGLHMSCELPELGYLFGSQQMLVVSNSARMSLWPQNDTTAAMNQQAVFTTHNAYGQQLY